MALRRLALLALLAGQVAAVAAARGAGGGARSGGAARHPRRSAERAAGDDELVPVSTRVAGGAPPPPPPPSPPPSPWWAAESRLLLVTSLDGRLTALHADTGRTLWSTSTGGPLLQASHPRHRPRRTADGGGGGDEEPETEPLIIPARDGSIMVASPGGGLQQLPYKAQELVNQLPITSGPVLVVGSKTSRVLQVSLASGRVLRTVSAAGPLCPQPEEEQGEGEGNGDGEDDAGGPSVWVGRSDYVVTAYDGSGRRQLWNVTYAELLPPEPAAGSGAVVPASADESSRAVAVATDGSVRPAGVSGGPARPTPPLLPALTASVRGELLASHPGTGALAWRSGSLAAPVVSAHALRLVPRAAAAATGGAGIAEVTPLDVSELWPSVAAGPGSWRQRLLAPNASTGGAGSPSRAGGGGGDDVTAFVGVLPGGQVYALPRGPHVSWEQVDLVGDGEDGDGGRGSPLLLPAPAATEGGADESEKAVTMTPPGSVAPPADGSGGSSTELWVSTTPRSLLPQLIGVHNVTRWGGNRSSSGGAGSSGGDGGSYGDIDASAPHLPPLPSLPPRATAAPFEDAAGLTGVLRRATAPQLVVASLVLIAAGAAATLAAVLVRRKGRRRQQQLLDEAAEAARAAAAAEAAAAAAAAPADKTDGAAIVPAAPPPPPAFTTIGGVRHRLVGRLAVSDVTLGYGSHGTIVFAGWWDGRPVAVKRMLRAFHGPSAAREIALLIRTDGHRNVVRYYACEQGGSASDDGDDGSVGSGGGGEFLYLALERCACSLAQAVERVTRAAHAAAAAAASPGTSTAGGKRRSGTASATPSRRKSGLPALTDADGPADAVEDDSGFSRVTGKGAAAVRGRAGGDNGGGPPVPPPSPQLRAFLRQVVEGLAHLHAHRILHRDIKPHNILLAAVPSPSSSSSSTPAADTALSVATAAAMDRQLPPAEEAALSRLYPGEARDVTRLAGGYVPKISDFGLGKQLPSLTGDGPSAQQAGGLVVAAAVGAAVAGGSSSSALLGRLTPGLRALLFGPHGGTGGAGALSSSSSAVTPGSTGWTAPEVVQAAIHHQRGGGAAASGSTLAEIPEGAGGDGDDDSGSGAGSSLSPAAATAANSTLVVAGARGGGDGAAASTSDAAAAVAATPQPGDAGSPFSFASDVWSLGATLYHVLDAGRHPFGEPWEREANMLRWGGVPALGRLRCVPEAASLLEALLHPDPRRRPSAARAAEHPFFWSDDARLALLCELSDRLEREGDGSALSDAVEARAADVLGGGSQPTWGDRLPAALYSAGGDAPDSGGGGGGSGTPLPRQRRYDFRSLGDCLRLLRNKRSHFRELPRSFVADAFGSPDAPPASLLPFFTAPHRFPRLFMAGYEVVCELLAHDAHFAGLLGPLTAAAHAPSSAQRAARARAPPPPPPLPPTSPPPQPTSPTPGAVGGGGRATATAGPLSPLLMPSSPAAANAGAAAAAAAPPAAAAAAAAAPPHTHSPQHPPAAPASRGWFLPEPGWLAEVAGVAVRTATRTGGAVVPATQDVDGSWLGGVSYLPSYNPGAARQGGWPGGGSSGAPLVMLVCAHERGHRTTGFAGGAHYDSRLYKTQPCKDWEASGGALFCPRGVRCDFAHGPLELRPRLPLGGGGGGGRRRDANAAATEGVSGESADAIGPLVAATLPGAPMATQPLMSYTPPPPQSGSQQQQPGPTSPQQPPPRAWGRA